MNLVQIQERLKDAPVQSIMQYANGMNPMVPPYLALAELKRRESISQSAQAQQAMKQGQVPSVKDQVEQAAGLASLQQQMQKQGLQSLMAQAKPQGIPENIPQPERQPESEGLSALPTRGDMFNFANGGIVAFAKGDFVGDDKVMSVDEMRAEYKRLLQANRGVEANAMLDRIKRFEPTEYLTVQTPVAPYDEAPQRAPAVPQMAEQAAAQPMGAPLAERRERAIPAPGNISGQIALPSRGLGAMPTGAPDDAAMMPSMSSTARGIAALPGAQQASDVITKLMANEPTAKGAFEAEREMTGLYGLTQPYGEERMKRIQQMEAARQQDLEGRGMERLMRVMGGIGGRGLAGGMPAYLQSVEAERSSDAEFRKQMDELLSGVEAKRREEQIAGMQRGTSQFDKDKQLRIQAAEKIFDAQRRREDEEFRIRLEQQLRMMQPTEASILMNVMADLRKRNPDKSEAEIYAMAREAQQGATPALKEQDQRLKAMNKAIEEWNNPLISMEKKNPQKLSEEQWIAQKAKYYEAIIKGQYDALSAAGASTGAGAANPILSKADAILAGGK